MRAWFRSAANRAGLNAAGGAAFGLMMTGVFAASGEGWRALLPIPFFVTGLFFAGRSAFWGGYQRGVIHAKQIVDETLANRSVLSADELKRRMGVDA